MTIGETIIELNDAADIFASAGGDTTALLVRQLANHLSEAMAALDAMRPILDTADSSIPEMIAAKARHGAAAHKAIDDLSYCPYDCDRCHDTSECPCINCANHRREYGDDQ